MHITANRLSLLTYWSHTINEIQQTPISTLMDPIKYLLLYINHQCEKEFLTHKILFSQFTFSFLSKMGDQKSRVIVHSVLTQVSSRPSASVETYPLTRLDHAMGHHTIHVIFYYEKSPFGSFDMDPIRVSLSEVLTSYPPVTGRLTRDDAGNWAVKCNDAGVRVLRARVGITLDEWLRSADGNEERDLSVWEDMPEVPNNWSPYRIQVLHFLLGRVCFCLMQIIMYKTL